LILYFSINEFTNDSVSTSPPSLSSISLIEKYNIKATENENLFENLVNINGGNLDETNLIDKFNNDTDNLDTETMLNQVINSYKKEQQSIQSNKQQSIVGGANETELSYSFGNQLLTENITDMDSNMIGGGKQIRRGTRMIKLLDSEVFSEGAKGDRRSRPRELSRLINNQATEIHNEVIKIIMKLMNVEEDIAKSYKAALWRMVKEKFPDIKSNLDKSVEMKKLATKKVLKTIDIDKYHKEVMEYRKKKAEKKKTKKKTKPKKDTKKNTKNKDTKKKDDDLPSETSPDIFLSKDEPLSVTSDKLATEDSLSSLSF
jgi:hypothetical protein